MSASLKPGTTGNRDPFAAYVCDETALDVLRPVVIELGWQPEKCNKGGLRNAIQSLSVSASPNILMVDLSESGDPLNDINALAEVCEPGTVVIAIGQVNDVRLYRDLLASGIHDYLLKPLSASMLRDSLNQAQAVFTAPRAGEEEGVKRHISAAVIGTRGGVGASTLVTSLAWLFSTEMRMPTALLDLDVHFGTGALTLDLEPGRGLTDAIDNPSRIDGLFIERAMIRANDNLSILSAEAPINHPLMTDGAAFMQLQEEFKHTFEMTVLDMPRNMMINFPHLLNDVNVVVLSTEMSLASARDTIRILSWLKTNAPHAKVLIVANRVQPGVTEISKADFETSIERKIDVTIPFDQKAAANAAKLGKTFVDANASSKASAAIKQLSSQVIGAGDQDAEEAEDSGAKKSLLGSFDFKNLLAKKKDAPVEAAAE
ncbi:pilus assembly protein CpaE [Erythrobacter sp.]|jgi:pilus assembly protein CpaE|uniref:pilus assembly protein CpaE n=1 Tax=Erythrobacter sp. TaxID=1042 RepID=UPI001B1C248C|nr:pilus assembly protein CpaE [Erythrobacter sp.]MBO6525732.1 pilus assembly protein CpaE [Erythrobacter sp.]MBO6529593.1 pilus assembly protein CpaE [Erythrobacter sp.]